MYPLFIDADTSPLPGHFQMDNAMYQGEALIKQYIGNAHVREKRRIFKNKKRSRHHSRMSSLCNNCNHTPSEKNLNKRKKLHAHTIDHLTRKHRPYKIDPRST